MHVFIVAVQSVHWPPLLPHAVLLLCRTHIEPWQQPKKQLRHPPLGRPLELPLEPVPELPVPELPVPELPVPELAPEEPVSSPRVASSPLASSAEPPSSPELASSPPAAVMLPLLPLALPLEVISGGGDVVDPASR